MSYELKGSRFGRWLVLARAPVPPKGTPQRYWRVRCDCGNRKVLPTTLLLRGKSQSCGCLRQELTARRGRREDTAVKSVFSRYRYDARKHGRSFTLSLPEFVSMTQRPCYYCGAAPSTQFLSGLRRDGTRGVYTYNGVDRLDNEQGYTLANCVACCATHNLMKGSMTKEQFIAACRSVRFK